MTCDCNYGGTDHRGCQREWTTIVVVFGQPYAFCDGHAAMFPVKPFEVTRELRDPQ